MGTNLTNKVAVIGVGCTKFGENFEMSWSDMAIDAAYEAFGDAGVEPGNIEAVWLGGYRPWYGAERNAGTPIATSLGMINLPITYVSNICATGMDAFRNAWLAVASGMYDVVLAIGVEKMRDLGSRILSLTNRAEGHPFIGKGRTAPAFFAMNAQRYFHKYGIDKQILAKVAVKNHHNGTLNPKAHFQREVSMKQVLQAPMVADPLGVLDCCPTTDGAAAAVLVRADLSSKFRNDPILVKGVGLAVGSELNVFDPDFEFLGFMPTQMAAQSAYKQAGVTDPFKQIDIAEVHDCFTITEILNYEDLLFCKRGEGWKLIDNGVTNIEGELPVNTDGGLKSFGHPIGASGPRMIYEVVKQLQGKAGPRQVKNPRLGLAHTLGGTGAIGCVVILGNT